MKLAYGAAGGINDRFRRIDALVNKDDVVLSEGQYPEVGCSANGGPVAGSALR